MVQSVISMIVYGAKCDKYDSLGCKVCIRIVYGAKCNLVYSLRWLSVISPYFYWGSWNFIRFKEAQNAYA